MIVKYVDAPSGATEADVREALQRVMDVPEIAANVEFQLQARRVRMKSSGEGQLQKAAEFFSECLYKVATGEPLPPTEDVLDPEPDPQPETFEPIELPDPVGDILDDDASE